MMMLYLALPLPVVFAGGRALIEWQAYRDTLEALRATLARLADGAS